MEGLHMNARSFTAPTDPYPELTAGLQITIVVQTKPGTPNSKKPGSAELTYTVDTVTKELVTLQGDENPRLTRIGDGDNWHYVFATDGYGYPVTEITVAR